MNANPDSTLVPENFPAIDSVVKIEQTSSDNIRGLVKSTSDSGILIHVIEDFHFDGLAFLTWEAIADMCSAEDEAFLGKIMKAEYPEPSASTDVSSASMEEFLVALQGRCTMLGTTSGELVFARIEGISNGMVTLTPFTSTGEYEEPIREAISEICSVRFENEYVRMYEKYSR